MALPETEIDSRFPPGYNPIRLFLSEWKDFIERLIANLSDNGRGSNI